MTSSKKDRRVSHFRLGPGVSFRPDDDGRFEVAGGSEPLTLDGGAEFSFLCQLGAGLTPEQSAALNGLDCDDALESFVETLLDAGILTAAPARREAPPGEPKPLFARAGAVPRLRRPTWPRFYRDFVAKGKPVVLTDMMDDWPARDLWTPRYLDALYGITPQVKSEMAATLRKYILGGERIEETTTDPRHRRILREHRVPFADQLSRPPLRALWYGAGDSLTGLHYDIDHNFHAVVFGRKQVVLFAPSDRRLLYPFPWWSRNHDESPLMLPPDLERHPLFQEARPFEAQLGPGDILFMPSGWWHFVRSRGPAITLSMFWAIPRLWPAMAAARARRAAGAVYRNVFGLEDPGTLFHEGQE